MQLLVRGHRDRHAIAGFDVLQMRPLLVEDVERDVDRRGCHQRHHAVGHEPVLDRAQDIERDRLDGAHHAGALAHRAGRGRAFEHAGAQALPRHFEQAEMADAAYLDARPVVAQRFLEAPLDEPVVAPLIHIDEVDDDEPCEVAEPQLPRDLLRGLEIGLERGVLDIVLARRLTRVHVDRDECLGLVDDDVAARLEGHLRREHRRELAFHLIADEDRLGLLVGLHVLRMARHEHAHEVLGLAIGVVARDQYLVDILVVEVADRALDQAALLVDEGGGRGFQREVADVLPQPQQIIVIALDLRLGALRAGRADDQPHALGHLELAGDLAQALAVRRLGDLARDAAAARRIRHQHRVTAGKR